MINKQRSRKYYIAHRQQIIEKARQYALTHKEAVAGYKQKWTDKNKGKVVASGKRWYEANKEAVLQKNRDRYATHLEEEHLRGKVYRQKHKAEITKRKKKRWHEDHQYRFKECLRNRLRMAIKKGFKNKRTTELLGCSWLEVRVWIEKQFQPGMSWENYGEWHIDHKKSCASFDLTKEAEQKICFHYTNLQPLWAVDNIVKSDS